MRLLLCALVALFAHDAAHDVAVFPDCALALRYAHRTAFPVLLYVAERDTFRKERKPIFRPGATHALTLYEDLSAVEMAPSLNGPPRCVLEVFAGGMPKDPLGREFRAAHQVHAAPLDRSTFCDGAGLTPESRGQVTAFAHFEARALQTHQPVHVYAWSTHGHNFVLGRRGDHPEKFQLQLRLGHLAAIKGNIDLANPTYHYVHW